MAVPFVFEFVVSFWKRIYLYVGKLCLYEDMAGKSDVSESDGSAFVFMALVSCKGRNGRRRMGDAFCYRSLYDVYDKHGYFYRTDPAAVGGGDTGSREKANAASCPDRRLSCAEYFFRSAVFVFKIKRTRGSYGRSDSDNFDDL